MLSCSFSPVESIIPLLYHRRALYYIFFCNVCVFLDSPVERRCVCVCTCVAVAVPCNHFLCVLPFSRCCCVPCIIRSLSFYGFDSKHTVHILLILLRRLQAFRSWLSVYLPMEMIHPFNSKLNTQTYICQLL